MIYNAQVDPRPAEAIATHCGVSKAVVHQVISTYNRFGVTAVETVGKGGRYHDYLRVDQEREFLAPFFARAQMGELASASESKRASARPSGARASPRAPFTVCLTDMAGAS
jgi:hypothetical protein